jgi:prephenate dehydrogenase
MECPKISKAKKFILFLSAKILRTHELLSGNEEDIERLLKKGWKMRKKMIKGKPYAYLQLEKRFKYVGVWREAYNRFQENRQNH